MRNERQNQVLATASLAISMMLLSGCAGPATPLGAIWATSPVQVKSGALPVLSGLLRPNSPLVRFNPGSQVLHRPSPMTVIIDDPGGVKSNYQLNVRYNSIDVTPSFFHQAQIQEAKNGKRLIIQIPVVRLDANADHTIEVGYGTGLSMTAYARLDAPSCTATETRVLTGTDTFTPPEQLLALIDRISREMKFNPALATALIAQESAFNPHTVSWAKAIGLTQITTTAASEIAERNTGWPRYPGIDKLSVPTVKALVMSGRLNETNEWRLDSERSIRGGVIFAKMLLDRWSTKENTTKIQSITFEDLNRMRTKLVLASYHSGYSRVLTALHRYGAAWLTSPDLKEARKYVNRVFSYCDHFSEERELFHENET